ncbi:MAG TPA: diacylglycerol kinase family protein [Pelobium sp.]|nr:diacylglycerol kinase family protein [Pelobium sp.]
MNKEQRVLFVINKKSGNRENYSVDETIAQHATKSGYLFKLYVCNKNVEAEIRKEIDNFSPTIVCAVGGDGTVNLVASIIQSRNISLLIVPFGSANGMAKELQIPPTLKECLDLINSGKIQKIDLLKVNDAISVHLADVGLNARIVRRFELDTKRGLLTYGKHLFYEIFLLKRNRFRIDYDGKSIAVKAVSLTFANATKYGTNATINPDGILNDGYFEICIVKPFPKYHVIGIAYKMFRNTLKYSEFFQVIKCKKAEVTCTKKTVLQNDGELMKKVSSVYLEILPNSLQVIINPRLTHPTIIN